MKIFDLIDDLGSELDYRLAMASYAVDELLGKNEDTEEDIQENTDEDKNEDEELNRYFFDENVRRVIEKISKESEELNRYFYRYFSDENVRKVIEEILEGGYLHVGDTVIPILEIEKYSSFVIGESGIEGQVTPKELRSIALKYGQIKKGRWVVVSSISYKDYIFYEDDGINIDELCRKLDITVMFTALFKGDSGLNF